MSEIISMLLLYIKIQNKIIVYLIGGVLGKNSYRKNLNKPANKPYRQLKFLSYPVSPNRDTPSAVKALDKVLMKFIYIPDDLKSIVDGNPIYVLAQHFFAQHDVFFDIISLSNDDPVSKGFRHLKQIIERVKTINYYIIDQS